MEIFYEQYIIIMSESLVILYILSKQTEQTDAYQIRSYYLYHILLVAFELVHAYRVLNRIRTNVSKIK